MYQSNPELEIYSPRDLEQAANFLAGASNAKTNRLLNQIIYFLSHEADQTIFRIAVVARRLAEALEKEASESGKCYLTTMTRKAPGGGGITVQFNMTTDELAALVILHQLVGQPIPEPVEVLS